MGQHSHARSRLAAVAAIATITIGVVGFAEAAAAETAPTAQNLSIVVPEDGNAAFVVSASDVDNDSLSFAQVIAPAHGTVIGTAPNLTYTPELHYVGADSVVYSVNDGHGGTATATISITVSAGAPQSVTQTVTARQSLLLDAPGPDVPPDGQVPTHVTATPSTSGTVSLTDNPNPALPAGVLPLSGVDVTAPSGVTALAFAVRLNLFGPDLALTDASAYRNGVRVSTCADSSGVANPDPCLEPAPAVLGSYATFTVLTSTGGTWSLGYIGKTSTLTIAPAQPTAVAGQSMSVGLYVTGPSSNTSDAGTVTLFDESTSPATVLGTLRVGAYYRPVLDSLAPTTLGAHTLQATYSGEAGVAGSTSATTVVYVNQFTSSTFPGTVFIGKAVSGYGIQVSGGTSPYTSSLVSGNPPPGVKVNTNGTFTGTPTALGTYSFLVGTHDAAKPPRVALTPFTITVVPMDILPPYVTSIPVGAAYKGQFTAQGGKASYVFSASGLPPGLKISAAGLVSGSPTVVGSFVATVNVHDSTLPTHYTATVQVTFTVAPMSVAGGQVIAQVGRATSIQMSTYGGKPTVTWKLTAGVLPHGMTFSTAGKFAGTPTQSGVSWVTLSATDATKPIANTASASLYILVNPATTFAYIPSEALEATVGDSIRYSGLVAPGRPWTGPLTYTVVDGALPPGIAIDSAGTVFGTYTTAGSFHAAVLVHDSSSPQQSGYLSFTADVASG